jgi:glycerate kinase
MRVLVAPDKFRGTLTAEQAAHAIETGWLRARPRDTVDVIPMADGGEGTLDALTAALEGETVTQRVNGPLGDPTDAAYGVADGEPGGLAIVESARASGIALVPKRRWNPLRSTTRGTGELIRAALEHRPARLIVCIGGSATNDGGAGMAQALGARLLQADGEPIRSGGAGLLELARIDMSGMDPALAPVSVIAASDVDNPLTGPRGASQVYGPQKGASADDVRLLDGALGHLAAVVHRDLGIDLRDTPGAGAAGGLGFGLLAFCGAKLRPGVEVVMEAVGFRDRLERADLVITGEGKLDEQSLRGKVPAGVLRVAQETGVPLAILCGRADVALPGVVTATLVERFGEERALRETRQALEQLAEELAARADLVATG